jgi:transcriptional regulator with AAA-type ATPase domain
MTAQVVVLRDNEFLLRFGIDRSQVCIGTNLTGDVVLEGDSLPPLAAVLLVRGGKRYTLRDFTGGTLTLRGVPLESEEVDLFDDDIFELGRYQLFVKSCADATPIRKRSEDTHLLPRRSNEPLGATVLYQGRRYPISTTAEFNIGRHGTNDLVVEDMNASSQHCRISHEDGGWVLEDLGSFNGTIVNDLTLSAGRIRFSSSIAVQIGLCRLSIEILAPGSATPNAEPRLLYGLVAESHALRSALEPIGMFAPENYLVLIQGEPGCGKEKVAQALHDASDRKNKPYIVFDAGTLSNTLIDNELFGHVKGAFTGATVTKLGAFEAASGGTLFIDEIGELPLELQPKLLRVLESYTIRRMGDTREIKVDTRVVAATNRDLYAMVERGEFRRDLFDRLSVLVIEIPPLRARPEDILPTARHFLRKMKPDRELTLSRGAEEELISYDWPGNVRELRNVIQRSLHVIENDLIRAQNLKFLGGEFAARRSDVRTMLSGGEGRARAKLIDALEETKGNKTKAAKLLQISRAAIYNRIKRYGVPKRDGDSYARSPTVRGSQAEEGRPKRRSASSDTQMSRATELVDCHPRSSAVRSGAVDEAPTRELRLIRSVASERHRPARLDSRDDDGDTDLPANDVD